VTVYLPIAELSVNVFVILGMGAAVGFLSGMFGVGGGFLITPLLIFYNIPPAVAVATGANQVVASSISGAISHFRRGTLDIKLGVVLLVGGLVGATLGVRLFVLLRQLGQLDLIVSLLYVILLGTVGGLMLYESINSMRRAARNETVTMRKPGQHNWVHRLPFKMRFKRSKLYLSVIPVLALGFSIGILTSIMGVGGGFIMVPAMIYLLRIPTNVVIGTSLFQIIFVTAFTTVVQATTNYSVDIVLAGLLMIAGVIGAQYGVRVGQRMRGEQLRAGLALLVLAVGIRLGLGLVLPPDEIYSIETGSLGY
jgi:Predicted permeases